MWIIMNIITRIFDVILFPFKGLHPMVGLLFVSALTGVVMLAIFGKTSNQKGISKAKGRLKGFILEIWLFKDDPKLMLKAFGKVLYNNIFYLRYTLPPLAIIIVPVLLIMVQLNLRYAHEPFDPGDTTVLKVTLSEGNSVLEQQVRLDVPDGISVVTPPLRIPEKNEVDWRLRVDEPGDYTVGIIRGDDRIEKRLVAEGSIVKIAASKGRAFDMAFIGYPSERPIPSNSAFRSVEMAYPLRYRKVLDLGMWGWIFFAASIVAGFALKGPLKVQI
jgi:hypothetical protein